MSRAYCRAQALTRHPIVLAAGSWLRRAARSVVCARAACKEGDTAPPAQVQRVGRSRRQRSTRAALVCVIALCRARGGGHALEVGRGWGRGGGGGSAP